MSKLDSIQSVIEKLYYEISFKDSLSTDNNCKCKLVNNRIKDSLRSVICDLILLKTIKSQT